MEQQRPIAILGGGVAGLAAGFSAQSLGLPFRIFEKAGQTGGNCVTFSQDGFRFDSGAHRLHDRDAEATGQLRRLLGNSCPRVSVPSQVCHREKFLTFPFKTRDLAAKLGWPILLRIAGEVLVSRLRGGGTAADFASAEKRNYGRTLARLFLLNYSEKLWGLPGEQLAVEISGSRLTGLNLMTFIRETFLPASSSAQHLEGPFYYPDGGIGAVSDSLACGCGLSNIRLHAEISRVFHDGRRIRAVEINRRETVACSAAISSIPLDRFLSRFDPPPPPAVLHAAAGFRFRQLALAAFFSNRDSLTRAATIYFPDPNIPFTRVYEPKNRCALMAPPGQTSLVAEVPYSAGDSYEFMDDGSLIERVRSHLVKAGLLTGRDVQTACVRRLADAYPILEKDVESRRREIFLFLRRFANLKVIGRCGTFRYLHIHNLLTESVRAVEGLRSRETTP